MTKRRIFITGAAGFIAFHLAHALKGDALHENVLFGIDNFNDYYDVGLKRARAQILKDKGVLAVIEQDLASKDALQKIIHDFQPTHVVHLAAQAGVRYSLKCPEVYLKSNIDGFLNLLEVLKTEPSIKLVYASSSSVYGNNKKVPFSIHDTTDHPANVYGVTKKTGELMAYTYHSLFGICTVGLRFFTVYVPWGRPDMAYFLFTKAILEGRTIDLFHNGVMRRDFTYVDDIVKGIVQSLSIENGNHLFNLGNNKPESVERLVELIEHETGKKASKRFLPMPEGEIIETFADIDLTKEKLGFNPSTSLDKGIQSFVSWYKSYCHV
ncbi:MAG TPA: NAD-dependent epimerase/dehydratase family protein [Chlamydiales bacterium]|nr:NAD-dependent epimerase/dehydratase family protein [Chlamydiales bacterium]